MKVVTLTLTFRVVDEDRVREAAEEGARMCWGADLESLVDPSDLGAVVMEALISSNLGVPSYDTFGLESIAPTGATTREEEN